MAIVDHGDGSAPRACTLLSGLTKANGIAYDAATRSLYVAEPQAIKRFDGVDDAALAGCDPAPLSWRLVAGPELLPDAAMHSTRHLGLSPVDGKLYANIGAPFNIGNCTNPFCTIVRMNRNGSGVEFFARGVRNAAGFTWHPGTGQLVFSGMERDLMGALQAPAPASAPGAARQAVWAGRAAVAATVPARLPRLTPPRAGDDQPDDLLGLANTSTPGVDFRWPYCHWWAAKTGRARCLGRRRRPPQLCRMPLLAKPCIVAAQGGRGPTGAAPAGCGHRATGCQHDAARFGGGRAAAASRRRDRGALQG